MVVEIPVNDPKAMEAFQEMMDRANQAMIDEVNKLATELGVSQACAMDVWYLRSRSRHTPELEAELIAQHKLGINPDMNEFGHPKLIKEERGYRIFKNWNNTYTVYDGLVPYSVKTYKQAIAFARQ